VAVERYLSALDWDRGISDTERDVPLAQEERRETWVEWGGKKSAARGTRPKGEFCVILERGGQERKRSAQRGGDQLYYYLLTPSGWIAVYTERGRRRLFRDWELCRAGRRELLPYLSQEGGSNT